MGRGGCWRSFSPVSPGAQRAAGGGFVRGGTGGEPSGNCRREDEKKAYSAGTGENAAGDEGFSAAGCGRFSEHDSRFRRQKGGRYSSTSTRRITIRLRPEKMMSRTTGGNRTRTRRRRRVTSPTTTRFCAPARSGPGRNPIQRPTGRCTGFMRSRCPWFGQMRRVDLLGISTDITERAGGNSLLIASQFNDEVVRSFQDGLLILDRSGAISSNT